MPNKLKSYNLQAGFSLVEVILASSIFGLLVTALTGAFLYGQQSTALAGGRARAELLAEEGLEAARSIRDSGFGNLSDGDYGLAISGNQWKFTGSQDTSDIFTRQVSVSTAEADKRKKITSSVSWQQNAQRTGTVVLTSLLNNWLASSLVPGGVLMYGDGSTTPKFRTYNSSTNTFTAEGATVASTAGRTFVLKTSPVRNEALAGFVTAGGVLNIYCYDGATWTQAWTATVGGSGSTRRFDIAYSTSSGDAMVLYSTNTATTNELAYRTMPGSTGCAAPDWSGATSFNPVRTSGVVHYVKMAWDRRTSQDLITAIWADANSDLSAAVWSGTAWGNEPTTATATNLQVITASQDVEDFDVEYESVSGDVMVVLGIAVGNNASGVQYRTCTGGISTCTWSAVTAPLGFADDATNLDISANPNTDQMVFASIGKNQSDLQLGYWSGTAWTGTANADITSGTPIAGSKIVSTGWLISGAATRSIVAYLDAPSTGIDWYVGNAGVFTQQTDFAVTPTPANPAKYFDIQMNPLSKDQLMYLISDNANDLLAKRLVMTALPGFTWTNADGSALETTLPQAITNPFAFAYWRL